MHFRSKFAHLIKNFADCPGIQSGWELAKTNIKLVVSQCVFGVICVHRSVKSNLVHGK